MNVRNKLNGMLVGHKDANNPTLPPTHWHRHHDPVLVPLPVYLKLSGWLRTVTRETYNIETVLELRYELAR